MQLAGRNPVSSDSRKIAARRFTSPVRAILLDYNKLNRQGDYVLGRLKDNRWTFP